MKKFIFHLNQTLATFTICLSVFLVVCVVWQVLSRYIFSAPSTITDELSRYLFMWVAMIGAAYTTGQKRHLAIDLLVMKLSGKRKLLVEIFIQIAITAFAVIVLIYGGSVLTIQTLAAGQLTPALGIEMGYVYFCLPITGILMVIYSIYFMLLLVTKKQNSFDIFPEKC
ncbi:TRAP transporter small permease [Aeromonas hydrophila]|jgi:TRAP-type C4-dicarboxylate transport system permease small subunit|uniref:TRAP transporter small permease protein n=2 Tax=Aeromonas TaxID=642 RepID=A0ABD7GBF8_AERHY|nr:MULTISPECIES: TRAP transporter small permease [Aeromonas]MDH1896282.1 TRAP transporter small permease [Aeromonas caviae]RCF51702.1 TRAP transporter small permease [Aeromonas hydrophila]RSM29318.1 TRAP transporter small permease [Aeromonas salmonicida]